MHVGLNSDVNKQIRNVGIRHNVGVSKVKLLSHSGKVKHKETETLKPLIFLGVWFCPDIRFQVLLYSISSFLSIVTIRLSSTPFKTVRLFPNFKVVDGDISISKYKWAPNTTKTSFCVLCSIRVQAVPSTLR